MFKQMLRKNLGVKEVRQFCRTMHSCARLWLPIGMKWSKLNRNVGFAVVLPQVACNGPERSRIGHHFNNGPTAPLLNFAKTNF